MTVAKETYNLWVIKESDTSVYKYLATVVSSSFKEAREQALIGCNITEEELQGWVVLRNNPKYY